MSFVEDPGQRLSHGPIAHPSPRRPLEEVVRVVAALAFPEDQIEPGLELGAEVADRGRRGGRVIHARKQN